MRSPPVKYWVLSATVYGGSGPKHLDTRHAIRRETFKDGFQNGNIVMVDFIERFETKISVVDKCITLNKLRSFDNTPPSIPAGLSVTRDEQLENSFCVKWVPSTDNIGVVRYEVYMGDKLLVSTNENEYQIPYLRPHVNHVFKVRSFDFLGTPSEFSPPFNLEQDVTSPTIPGNFRFYFVGFTNVSLNWDVSSDDSGIAGYELRRNGIFIGLITVPRYHFDDLVATDKYTFDVRAKDNNGLYSSWTSLTLEPRPALKNPKVIITEYEPVNEYYRAVLMWDKIEEPQFPIIFTHNFRGFTTKLPHVEGVAPNVGFGSYDPGEKLTFKSWISFDNGFGNSSEDFIYDFTFDPTRPDNITDLKLTSRTPDNTSIAWTPSVSKNVSNYAISLNGGSPKLVPASESSYVFEQMPIDEEFLIEVWAVSPQAFPSIVESITALRIGLPGKPGPIQVGCITANSAELYWEQSTGDVSGYEITINNGSPILVTDNSHTIVELKEATTYAVELRAFNSVGDMSEPEFASFTTKYSLPGKPGTPQVSQITSASAEVRWAASSGLDILYQVFLNGFLIVKTSEPRFTISHLKSHFDYRVEVRAFNPGGVSEPAGATFKTLLAPPANLRFSHTNGLCRLAWNPVFGKLPSHEISINGRVFNTGPGRWGYTFKLSDLSPGPTPHRFTFKVRAQLDGASSEASLLEKTLVDDVPPTQPSAPIASDITDTSVKLTWEPSSDNIGVTGYRVVLNGFLAFTTEDTSYTFTKLTPGAFHYVFVRAQDKDGNLSASSKPTVFKTTGQPPAPPPNKPNVSITDETDASLTLEWGTLDGASGVRILLNDELWRDVLLLPGVTMGNLTPSVEYTISVAAFDVFGQLSEPTVLTHELKDTTAPSSPGNLRETTTSDSVTLNWEASTDDIGLCDYVIYNNHEYFDRTPLNHYSAIGLMPGDYVFEVRALDLSGNLSEPASIAVNILVDDPNAPSNFRHTQSSDTTILEWDAPDEPVTGYRVILINPQDKEFTYFPSAPTLRERLPSNTRYRVRITARSAAGESTPLIAELTTK
ncbi:fibronectin type III domain-containing protein [Pseudomonas sp. NFX98]|uniref:fibronectin type III domain-containing protein n=1 Tax=Pseudomonas sp. NFX98 TaxID=3399122 RepID=UPI0039FC1415